MAGANDGTAQVAPPGQHRDYAKPVCKSPQLRIARLSRLDNSTLAKVSRNVQTSHVKSWLHHHGYVVKADKLHPAVARVIAEWFDLVDDDGSRTLEHHELLAALKAAQIPCDDDTIREMIKMMDMNNDGVIGWDEFEVFMTEEFAAGKNLLSGEYLLPSGLSINFGVMIGKLKRDKLLGDVMEEGSRRAKWADVARDPILMGNELALMQKAAAATSLTLEHLRQGAADADGGGATPRTALTNAILHSMDYGRQLDKAGGRWEVVRELFTHGEPAGRAGADVAQRAHAGADGQSASGAGSFCAASPAAGSPLPVHSAGRPLGAPADPWQPPSPGASPHPHPTSTWALTAGGGSGLQLSARHHASESAWQQAGMWPAPPGLAASSRGPSPVPGPAPSWRPPSPTAMSSPLRHHRQPGDEGLDGDWEDWEYGSGNTEGGAGWLRQASSLLQHHHALHAEGGCRVRGAGSTPPKAAASRHTRRPGQGGGDPATSRSASAEPSYLLATASSHRAVTRTNRAIGMVSELASELPPRSPSPARASLSRHGSHLDSQDDEHLFPNSGRASAPSPGPMAAAAASSLAGRSFRAGSSIGGPPALTATASRLGLGSASAGCGITANGGSIGSAACTGDMPRTYSALTLPIITDSDLLTSFMDHTIAVNISSRSDSFEGTAAGRAAAALSTGGRWGAQSAMGFGPSSSKPIASMADAVAAALTRPKSSLDFVGNGGGRAAGAAGALMQQQRAPLSPQALLEQRRAVIRGAAATAAAAVVPMQERPHGGSGPPENSHRSAGAGQGPVRPTEWISYSSRPATQAGPTPLAAPSAHAGYSHSLRWATGDIGATAAAISVAQLAKAGSNGAMRPAAQPELRLGSGTLAGDGGDCCSSSGMLAGGQGTQGAAGGGLESRPAVLPSPMATRQSSRATSVAPAPAAAYSPPAMLQAATATSAAEYGGTAAAAGQGPNGSTSLELVDDEVSALLGQSAAMDSWLARPCPDPLLEGGSVPSSAPTLSGQPSALKPGSGADGAGMDGAAAMVARATLAAVQQAVEQQQRQWQKQQPQQQQHADAGAPPGGAPLAAALDRPPTRSQSVLSKASGSGSREDLDHLSWRANAASLLQQRLVKTLHDLGSR